VYFIDNSFLDVWLSDENDYSYHWEQRAQRGLIHRWDNAPIIVRLNLSRHHFHNGEEIKVVKSNLFTDSKRHSEWFLGLLWDKLKELRID